jgi:deoxyribodipyrimidine photo-lyase
LLWLRRELRLADNPALEAALATGRPVLPVFVLDEDSPGAWAPGGASRWWLHHSLAELAAELAARGAPLVLRRGRFEEVIPRLVAETGGYTFPQVIIDGTVVGGWDQLSALDQRGELDSMLA